VEYKLDSGATRVLYEAPADYLLRYSVISPDGKSLAFYEGGGENVKALVVIPMEGGQGRDLIREKGPYIGPALWTPDSKSLLVARGFLGEKNALWLYPAGPGEKPRKILDFDVTGTVMSLHPDGRTLAFHSGWPKFELWTATNVLPAR
jgi:Tol biopolymer transport system component